MKPPREPLRSARDERRRFDRLRIELDAEIRPVDQGGAVQGEAFTARVQNLGPEGAFLVLTPEHPPVQSIDTTSDRPTTLEMRFALGDGRDPVRALAEVRWERDLPEGRGLGVQFVRVSDFEKQAIYYFCLRKYAEARGLI